MKIEKATMILKAVKADQTEENIEKVVEILESDKIKKATIICDLLNIERRHNRNMISRIINK